MRMKCISKMLVVMLLFVVAIPSFSIETFTENGFIYKVQRDNCSQFHYNDTASLVVIDYMTDSLKDYSTPLHIAASVRHNGRKYSVTRIETGAFRNHAELQAVVVDEGIMSIGKEAFDRCISMKSIYLPASLSGINGNPFTNCSSLASIVVDERNENLDSRDGCNAIIAKDDDVLLAACSSATIPSSVRKIACRAFDGCNMMERFVVPEGVETIESFAFSGCGGMKEISLPETLKGIDHDAFWGCTSLASIVIPKNVSDICFGNIFNGCYNLGSITVDDANTVYDSRSNCNGIVRKSDSTLVATCRATVITNDIRSLDSRCYSGTLIHSLNIPKSLTSIKADAFSECWEIDDITVESDNAFYCSPSGFNVLLSRDGKTLVLGSRTAAIPDGVEEIGDFAFCGRYMKSVLDIPKSVKRIGSHAFRDCGVLSDLVMPETVERIGESSFSNCRNLRSVILSPSLKNVPDYAFSYCHSLSAVVIPKGIETIGNYAFMNCSSLETVSLPSTAANIDREAFAASTKVTKK